MKALLLAAGKGDRFFPFSTYRAKPMFPVCNRPLLAWLVDRVLSANIREIGIVVGTQDGSIRSYFGDGTRIGCKITYIEQPEPRGTADAVVCAREFIGKDPVVIIHGDLYIEETILPDLITAFDQNIGIGATITVDHVDEQSRVDSESGRLTDCVWKPRGGRGVAAAGIYVFPSEIITDLANVPNHPKVQFGIAPPSGNEISSVIPILAREGRALQEVRLKAPVLDLDYPWQPDTFGDTIVQTLGRQLTESSISQRARIDPDARIEGPVFVDDDAVIGRDAHIKGPVWIGKRTHVTEGSHIGSHTIIGDDCHIGPYAKVSGFVGDDCHITYLGEFNGTMLEGGRATHQIQLSGVFGQGAEIGAGTQCGTLRFDDGPIEVDILGQRRVATGFSGVLFGDYSRTGVGAMMMPGRIVGPCSMVGAGVVLMKNLAPHQAILLKQETETIDWSPEIYNR